MGLRKLRAVLDRSASASLFHRTLSQIPTLFGQLMYLASLRDPNSGDYRHHGLAAAFGRDSSVEALKKSHAKVFRQWLKLTLEQRRDDLNEYLESLDDPQGLVVKYWMESRGYLRCVPDSVGKASREHYSSDLTRLLQIVSRSEAAATPDPRASPRR